MAEVCPRDPLRGAISSFAGNLSCRAVTYIAFMLYGLFMLMLGATSTLVLINLRAAPQPPSVLTPVQAIASGSSSDPVCTDEVDNPPEENTTQLRLEVFGLNERCIQLRYMMLSLKPADSCNVPKPFSDK